MSFAEQESLSSQACEVSSYGLAKPSLAKNKSKYKSCLSKNCLVSNAARDRLIRCVSQYFEKFGYLVFEHSWKFIIIPTIICSILSLGLYKRVPEFDMDILYSLPVSTTTIAQENLVQTFPIERLTYIFLVSKTGENLLTKQALSNVDQMWTKLTHMKIPRSMVEQGAEPQDTTIRNYLLNKEEEGISLLNYEPNYFVGRTNIRDQYPFGNDTFFMFGDVCRRTAFNTCTVMSPLDLYLFPSQRGSPITIYDYPNFINIKIRMMYRVDSLLGGIKKKFDPETNKTTITSTTSFAFRLTLLGGPEYADQSAAWEQGALGFLQNFKLPDIDIYVRCDRSINDELARSSSLTGQDLLLLLIASVCVSSFTVLMNSSLDWYRTKTIPALCGVSTTVLAYGASVGFMYFLGMKHVPPAEATPFMMLGICVDDVFVIINAYALTYVYIDNPRRRIGLSIRDSGVSITITTLTNVIAFLVGSLSPYYAISVFCIFTAFGLFVGYVLCLTQFLGILAVFARYEQKRSDSQGRLSLIKQSPLTGLYPFDSPATAPTLGHNMIKKKDYKLLHDDSVLQKEEKNLYNYDKKENTSGIVDKIINGTYMPEQNETQNAFGTQQKETEKNIGNKQETVIVLMNPKTQEKSEVIFQDIVSAPNTSLNDSSNMKTSNFLVNWISRRFDKREHKQKKENETTSSWINEMSLSVNNNVKEENRHNQEHENDLLNEASLTRIDCFNSVMCSKRNKFDSSTESFYGNSVSTYDSKIRHCLSSGVNSLNTVELMATKNLLLDAKTKRTHTDSFETENTTETRTTNLIIQGFYVVYDLDNYALVSHNVQRHLDKYKTHLSCSHNMLLKCWFWTNHSILSFYRYFKSIKVIFFNNKKKKVLSENVISNIEDLQNNASIVTSPQHNIISATLNEKNNDSDLEEAHNKEKLVFNLEENTALQHDEVIKKSDPKKNHNFYSTFFDKRKYKKRINGYSQITTSDGTKHTIDLDRLSPIYSIPHALQEKKNSLNSDHEKRMNFVFFPDGLPPEPKGNVGNLARSFFMYYGPCLLNPITKTLVIAFFIMLTIVSTYYTMQLDTGLQLRDVTPYSSYLRDFYDVRETFFSKYGDECILFFSSRLDAEEQKNVNFFNNSTVSLNAESKTTEIMYPWWNLNVKNELIELNNFLELSSNIVYVMNGFMYFYKFIEEEEKDISTKEAFMSELILWLQTTEGKVLSSNFIIRDNQLVAWKIHYWMNFVDNTGVAIGWIENVRKFLKLKMENGYLPLGHVYTPLALHWETDLTIVKTTITSMVVALLAMSTIVFLLIRDFVAALIILLDIIFIDLAVIGTMPLLSLKLNMLTMVNLVLSIGFAVDYTTHITHCFTHCKGKTRNQRALESLCCIGFPITEGMITTYLAVGVLATSKKYVLVVVFRMMTCVLIYASMHGIIFIPLILSLIGPMHYNPIQVLHVKDKGISDYWQIDPKTGQILEDNLSQEKQNNLMNKSTLYVAINNSESTIYKS